MVILTIEIVADSPLSPTLVANSIADRVGPIFEASGEPSAAVKVHRISKGDYAESNLDPADCPHPVLVHVLRTRQISDEQLQNEIEQLTAAVADICNRDPAIVYIIYQANSVGPIARGGEIVQ